MNRKPRRIELTEDFVAITENIIEAIILRQFCDYNKSHSNDWFAITAKKIKEDCFLDSSEVTVRSYLKKLEQQGFIMSRENSNCKWDKTIEYKVNFNFVVNKMKECGYDGII